MTWSPEYWRELQDKAPHNNRHVSPDCRDANCGKCDGVAWDLMADAPTDCECPHHTPVTS